MISLYLYQQSVFVVLWVCMISAGIPYEGMKTAIIYSQLRGYNHLMLIMFATVSTGTGNCKLAHAATLDRKSLSVSRDNSLAALMPTGRGNHKAALRHKTEGKQNKNRRASWDKKRKRKGVRVKSKKGKTDKSRRWEDAQEIM